jgi:hypothetical protein
MTLLKEYFLINDQDHLNLISMKLQNLENSCLRDYLVRDKILDDFRVFWGLIESRQNVLLREKITRSEKTSPFRRLTLTTTEKKRNKKDNLRILKAELRREKRKTKMALKSLNKKIEFIMDEDAKVYLELKQKNFDKREVYLAYEKLKKRENMRQKELKSALNQEPFVVERRPSYKIKVDSKSASMNRQILSPTPKCSMISSSHIDNRNCKSLSKLAKSGNKMINRNSYHYKYMLKKSLSLEKGRNRVRKNKWLKKPEDIGNFPGSMRGKEARDTFYSEQKTLESEGFNKGGNMKKNYKSMNVSGME